VLGPRRAEELDEYDMIGDEEREKILAKIENPRPPATE